MTVQIADVTLFYEGRPIVKTTVNGEDLTPAGILRMIEFDQKAMRQINDTAKGKRIQISMSVSYRNDFNGKFVLRQSYDEIEFQP